MSRVSGWARAVSSVLLGWRRTPIYKGRGVKIGRGVHIRRRSVSIGDYSTVGDHCALIALIDIGRHVFISDHVAIVGGDHRFNIPGVPTSRTGPEERLRVTIQDGAFIASRAIILHGITIGEGAVVGPGSVVTKDVPPYSIVSKSPAEVIAMRQQDYAGIQASRQRVLARIRGESA